MFRSSRANNTPRQTHLCAQNVDHLTHNTPFQRFSPRWSAVWALHRCESWPHHLQSGGGCTNRRTTRRRHAVSQLLIVQNPHRDRHERRRTANKTWAQRQVSRKKLAQQTPSHRVRGTKLALLARNGPFWRVLCVLGEFCPAWTVMEPSRVSFLPPMGQGWSWGEKNRPCVRCCGVS